MKRIIFYGNPINNENKTVMQMRLGAVGVSRKTALKKIKRYLNKLDPQTPAEKWQIANIKEQVVPPDCSLEAAVEILKNSGITFVGKVESGAEAEKSKTEKKKWSAFSIFFGEPVCTLETIGLDKKIEGLPKRIGVVEVNKEKAIQKLIDYCVKFRLSRKLWKIEGLVKMKVPRGYSLEKAKAIVKRFGVWFVD